MTGWKVEPTGVAKTLTETLTNVEAIGVVFQGMTSGAGDLLVAGAGFDGVVVKALGGFFEEQTTGRLEPLMGRYRVALEATASAANAFLAGDELMAAATVAGAAEASAVAGSTAFRGGW